MFLALYANKAKPSDGFYSTIHDSIFESATVDFTSLFKRIVQYVSKKSAKPIVLLFDDIDTLIFQKCSDAPTAKLIEKLNDRFAIITLQKEVLKIVSL